MLSGATLGIHDHGFHISLISKIHGFQIYLMQWILSKSTDSKTHEFQIHGFLEPVEYVLTMPLTGMFNAIY